MLESIGELRKAGLKGIGIDIVNIERIERLIDQYADIFLKKVFTEAEIAYCGAKARPAIHFAGRWAAKEAFYKALAVSCKSVSSWRSMEALPGASSRHPVVTICSEQLRRALEREGVCSIHLSISHEHTYCVAMVALA